MEKSQLINFVAKVMEESGFQVHKNFKTSIKVVDIYAVLPTSMGDFGIVMECNNYDKQWEVGVDILKEMEKVGENLNSSKVAIVTTSRFSAQSKNYANKKNIKLVDRDDLLVLAKKYSNKKEENESISNFPKNEEYIEPDNYGYEDSYSYNENSLNNNDYYQSNNVSPDNSDDNYYNEDYEDLNNYNDQDLYDDQVYSYNYLRNQEQNKSNQNSLNSLLSRKKDTNKHPLIVNDNYNNFNNERPNIDLRPILSNTISLVLMVVVTSYVLAIALEFLMGLPTGFAGLIELIVALILSYVLVSVFDREGMSILIKGTIVFFISFFILIIMTVIL
ncbi:restriction endonuclease [Methanobrevibacter sp. DSM 116169]|uniref:restriction endonuclease n=1 Tax=Methanobrevibacter sp. DSM 116169 TaxID=3242727 RepID=UPI0038FC2BBD